MGDKDGVIKKSRIELVTKIVSSIKHVTILATRSRLGTVFTSVDSS